MWGDGEQPMQGPLPMRGNHRLIWGSLVLWGIWVYGLWVLPFQGLLSPFMS